MAADILLMNSDVVPVGKDQAKKDQAQHVEYAADIADSFNHLFGDHVKLKVPNSRFSTKKVPKQGGSQARRLQW